MAMVLNPAARSLIIMTSFLFQRSTSAPAIGLNSTVGPKLKKPIKASAVAWPVICQAQMVRANPLMAEPISEMTCPNQTIVKPTKPFGRSIGMTAFSNNYRKSDCNWLDRSEHTQAVMVRPWRTR